MRTSEQLDAIFEHAFYAPEEVYPGLDPSRLARIGRTPVSAEYVASLYGEEVAESYCRLRHELERVAADRASAEGGASPAAVGNTSNFDAGYAGD